jgi:AraC-like DNA-binding protein
VPANNWIDILKNHYEGLYAKPAAVMKLYIKYMVSLRCKMLVKAELENMGLHYRTVDLGEADIEETLDQDQTETLKKNLARSGLELMDDKKAILIERVKNVVVEMVHYADEYPKTKNSVYISEKLHHDYTYIANLFSEATGITIEHFIILHKIEKAKELLLYNELNLTEIAWQLNYSSVAHLSNQFKKVTGLTPTYYKKLGQKRRNSLEDL